MFQAFLHNNKLVVLDGAMGTELQRRGYDTKLPLWSATANFDSPELVEQIHKDFILAGADIITTNTFRTTKRTFSKAGTPKKAVEATQAAVALAKKAAKSAQRKIFIAGSVTTLEDCYEPGLVPEKNILEQEHTFQIKLLASLEVDFILVETINSISEASAISKIIYELGIPFLISFVTDGNGNLLSGEPLNDAVLSVIKYSPLGIMLNCRSLEVLDNDLSVLQSVYKGVTGVYANGCGKPAQKAGWDFDEHIHPTENYIQFTRKWISQGIKVIGGCCGTTPEYIKAISLLKEIEFVNLSNRLLSIYGK